MIEWWMVITSASVSALFFFTSIFRFSADAMSGLAISFGSFWLAILLAVIKLLN